MFTQISRSVVLISPALAAVAALAIVGACQGQSSRDILTRPAPPVDHRLSYGTDEFQFGDLRLPKGAGPHPVAIVIHGGCWMSEYGLSYMGHLSAALTEAGVATWCVEYRRVGNQGGGWPGTFEDVARAADHLRKIAKTYPLDLNQVIAVGHSAGGHLALWLAARKLLPKDSKKKGDDAKLVVIEKAGHFEVVDPQSFAWEAVRNEVLALLKTSFPAKNK